MVSEALYATYPEESRKGVGDVWCITDIELQPEIYTKEIRVQKFKGTSKFDGKHQPSRPAADDDDVCICIFHVRNKRGLVTFLQA